MTGFYSKDLILESAYGQLHFSSTVVYVIATIGAIFTTLYSVKVLYLTFLTYPNGPLMNYKQAQEGDIFMSLPLIILAVFSIFFGFITKDMFIGLGSGFFLDNALFIHPSHEIIINTEFGVPTIYKLLPLIFTVLFTIFAIVLFEYIPIILIYCKLSRIGYNIFSFFNQRFLIELFYNRFITGIVLKLGGQTTKVLDKGSVEHIGPYGLEKGLLNISNNIAKLSTGVITSYALYILVGLVFYMLFSSYPNNVIIILILAVFMSFYLVLQDRYDNNNLFLQSNFGKTVGLFLDGVLCKLCSITWKKLLIILGSFIIFFFIRRPLTAIIYSLMPWHIAFLVALLFGSIISKYYYKNINYLLNYSVLDNHIYEDLVYWAKDIYYAIFCPYLLISTAEILISKKLREEYAIKRWEPLDIATKKLQAELKNGSVLNAKKLEVIGGAMDRENSDDRHAALSHVFSEYSRDEYSRIKSMYIEALLLSKKQDDANRARYNLDKINRPEDFLGENDPITGSSMRAIRELINTENVRSMRSLWRALNL